MTRSNIKKCISITEQEKFKLDSIIAKNYLKWQDVGKKFIDKILNDEEFLKDFMKEELEEIYKKFEEN